MLYKKNDSPELDKELFQNPTSEYRGAPFWSWNCRLKPDMLLEQIDYFKEMGFGGFHIHVRTGLETPYLGQEYMKYVDLCLNKAIEEDMFCWLYDEDRYPSGTAGGTVTKELKYRARYLLLSREEHPELEDSRQEFNRLVSEGEKPRGYYLASYKIILEDGYLKEYQRINRSRKPEEGQIWHAFIRLSEESPWYNDQTYVDVLNQEALERFIEVTHEQYYQKFGAEFGQNIPAIFTDEPQMRGKSTFRYAESDQEITMAFTDDLSETYQEEYDEDLLAGLPELFWQLSVEEVSRVRYQYHEHISERFVTAFSDTLGEWCSEHDIALTGHLMSERTLYSQTLALGEAMRCYRSFQLPGVDILCNQKEFSTVKQAVSVAHQYDREGVLSELYGVTHWYHDFKGHKLQGDWQAALGVTIRVPHLSFLSMEGEAKRDWPASINYQSPWFREYPFIEDHFSRLNTALTRGQADINIGVIHPIESFWLFFGPNDQTGALREQYDQNYKNLISWLLYGLLDFDFISEALLPDLCPEAGNPLQVGAMNYETIIVPDCKTLRSSTVERLEKFQKQGGTIIFVGKIPTHIDVVPSERIKKLADNCQQIQFNRYELLEALDEERKVEVRKANGKLSTNLFHQLRDDNECKWLFLGHVNRRRNLVDRVNKYKIKIKGRYNPLVYDTLSGEIKPCPAKIVGSDTIIDHQLYAEDSLLLKLVPGVPEKKPEPEKVRFKTSLKKSKKLSDPVDFSLSEPNVLLLDQAEYAFNDGQFQKKKEVLKIDNEFRDRLGIPRRRDHIRQPYTYDQDYRAVEDKLSLRYLISSKIKPSKVELALENPHKTTISLNGQQVESEVNCFFTDKAIKTISLPELKKGRNELILEIPFGRQTNVEWCYLLGNFGVEVKGSYKYIIEPTRKLAFGDWVVQGLPFYAGNVTYRCPLEVEENISEAVLEIPHFSAPVIKVCLDGKRRGLIAFAPHRLNLGELLAGQHLLEITVYGDRYNAFGTLHNANDEFKWYGPDSYRTTGSEWTDTYLLRKMGVLSRPVIYKK